MDNFADRLTERTRRVGHPLCVGLDPYLERIPPAFRGASDALTIGNFLDAVLDVIDERIAIVKPQIALFERLGTAGLTVLEKVIARARANGLLVLLDAKRGDIGATARGYAEAYLGGTTGFDVDAVTVNPYMGLDAVEPFVEIAASNGRGVVVLVRNSNPGADAFQLLETGGRALFEVVAHALVDFERRLLGREGWSSLGVTVSAGAPGDALRVRAQLSRALFLVLGYGAQGGAAADAVAGLACRGGRLEGGIVNSSRAVLYPALDGSSWEAAVERSLQDAIDRLVAVGCGGPPNTDA